MSNVGRLIRAARQKKGWTVKELAAAIGRPASNWHISQIETTAIQGTPDTLRSLGKVLGINEQALREAYIQNAIENAAAVWSHGRIERETRTKCNEYSSEIPFNQDNNSLQSVK